MGFWDDVREDKVVWHILLAFLNLNNRVGMLSNKKKDSFQQKDDLKRENCEKNQEEKKYIVTLTYCILL